MGVEFVVNGVVYQSYGWAGPIPNKGDEVSLRLKDGKLCSAYVNDSRREIYVVSRIVYEFHLNASDYIDYGLSDCIIYLE